jgi:hypothetical protein
MHEYFDVKRGSEGDSFVLQIADVGGLAAALGVSLPEGFCYKPRITMTFDDRLAECTLGALGYSVFKIGMVKLRANEHVRQLKLLLSSSILLREMCNREDVLRQVFEIEVRLRCAWD